VQIIYIDLVTVFIAAILNLLIGYVWYSKWLLGPFCKKTTLTPLRHLYMLIGSLITAYFLSFFELYLQVATVADGMFIGFCVWLGFVGTTQLFSAIRGNSLSATLLIDSGCTLLSFIVMGGVIGA